MTGFIGIALLMLDPTARLDSLGIVAALSAGTTMALGNVLVKRWQRPVSLLVFTAWQLAVGGAFLLPIALVVEGPFKQLSIQNLQGIIYLAIVATGLAYLLWFRGIDRLNPSAVSYLILLSPVVATLIGFFWLNQGFMPIQLLGITLIFISVVLGQKINSTQKGTGNREQGTGNSE